MITINHKFYEISEFLKKSNNNKLIRYLNDIIKEYNKQYREKEKLYNANIDIQNEITKLIKDDYFKAREFKEKIQKSELCQGDYPIAYYHAEWLEDTTDEYLNKLQELKGSDKE